MQLQFLVLLLCALYGSVFTLGKLTLEYSSPLFITGARMLLAAVILLAYQYFFNRKHFSFKKQHLFPAFIIGLTNVYLTNAFEFWGLQYMDSGKACFIYSFSPIATALMSYFWFSEKITLHKWLGLLIGILGFVPILMANSNAAEDSSGYVMFLSFAELALLGAAVFNAVGWMTMRVMVKDQGCTGVMANSVSMLLGGVMSLVNSWFMDDWNPVPVSNFWPFIQYFLILTLVSNIICYNLNAYLLRHFTATYLSFTGLSQPLFAALFGFIFLQEVVSEYFWISVAAVSVGLFIYYRQELRQGYMPQGASQQTTTPETVTQQAPL